MNECDMRAIVMAVIPEYLDERLRDVERSTQSNQDKIEAHEDVCAVRYGNINSSIASINQTIRWAGGGLIVGMLTILAKLLFFPSP